MTRRFLPKQQRIYKILSFIAVTWYSATILRAGGRTMTSIQQLIKCPQLIRHPSVLKIPSIGTRRREGRGWVEIMQLRANDVNSSETQWSEAIPNTFKAISSAIGCHFFGRDCFTLPLAGSRDRSQ